MRSYLGLAGLVVLAACGGDSSSGPQEPTYPAASGTYAISGGFDGFTPQQANFAGTLTIAQASRENPALTGNFNVTATVGGDVFVLAGALQSATITNAGVLSFAEGDASSLWSFSGTLSGSSFRAGIRSPMAPTHSPATGRHGAQGTLLPHAHWLLAASDLGALAQRLGMEASR